MLAVRVCLCLQNLSVLMQAQPWNLAVNWFFFLLYHLVQWPKPGREGLQLGLLWGLSTPSTCLGRLLCYRICLQVQGFPLICWIKPRHSSLPMLGLCHLQRLCQSKGRAVQARIRIHTTAYEKVSRLCFLCCRHCIINFGGFYFGFFWWCCGVFFPLAYWICLFFVFWAIVQILGFPLTPVTSCPWGCSSTSLDKPGALYVVTCGAGTLRQFHLHLEVLISKLRFLPLPYICRPDGSNVLRLFH